MGSKFITMQRVGNDFREENRTFVEDGVVSLLTAVNSGERLDHCFRQLSARDDGIVLTAVNWCVSGKPLEPRHAFGNATPNRQERHRKLRLLMWQHCLRQ